MAAMTAMAATHPLWISMLGAIVGLVLGLTGAGGGALAVPLLVFGAGLTLHQAAPMSLVAVGLSALAGALLGLRAGVVRYRAAALIGAAGMAAAPVGLALAHALPAGPLMLAFAAFMLHTAWRMVRRPAAGPRMPAAPSCVRAHGAARLTWTPRCALAMTTLGAAAGVLSGLLGIGGGFVLVPALERRTNLDLPSIQATSLAVIALVAVSGLAAAAWRGGLEASTAAPFAAGALAGLLAGRRLAGRWPVQRVRQAFALTAAGLAALLLARAAGWLP